ncbi:exocyst subunit exo70 family protein [Sesbania bispinosa]|nr:exocyst subunit exo70 family protein [Sesbania bispinosa]
MALVVAPEDAAALVNLESAYSDVEALLRASEEMEDNIETMETRFHLKPGSLSTQHQEESPLCSPWPCQGKHLITRINRAISPALAHPRHFQAHRVLSRTTSLISHRNYQQRSHIKNGSRSSLITWIDEFEALLLKMKHRDLGVMSHKHAGGNDMIMSRFALNWDQS